MVACGAIARHVADIAARRGWPVDVHPLPPLLHNRPERIATAVEARISDLRSRYRVVAVGFADCGTYGALDELCTRLGVRRLSGAHCYDVFAGAQRMRAVLADEPGTYVLTDFLVLSFRRCVIVELGLDRFPELREDYFRHYRRVVWLAQHPTAELRAAAAAAAAYLALPLDVVVVGDEGLERDLEELLGNKIVPVPFPARRIDAVQGRADRDRHHARPPRRGVLDQVVMDQVGGELCHRPRPGGRQR